MMSQPSAKDDLSLAGFIVELSRRRSRTFAAHLNGESRTPLPAILYRIYEAPYTLEHRTVVRILKAIVRNSLKSELHEDELTALSPDMLHLLYYLISDFKECRYSPEQITVGVHWLEGQFRDLGT